MSRFVLQSWDTDGTGPYILDPAQLGWGGSYTDCARRLRYQIQPADVSPLGGAVELSENGVVIFSGMITRRRRDSSGQMIEVEALDKGIYLKRNSTCIAVRQRTPEELTTALCKDYGITVGRVASTGVRLDRNFFQTSLYQIIQTMYTMASIQTGIKYQVRFRGDMLEVIPKSIAQDPVRLEAGVNILTTTSMDDLESLITDVGIYDESGRRIRTYHGDPQLRALYGRMEQAVRETNWEDADAQAQDILREHGVNTTISAVCLGNRHLQTGETVVVHEPISGLDGVFWISSDQHDCMRGIYRTTVTLDYRCLMDEHQAGSAPNG